MPWPRFQLSDPKMKEIIAKFEITGIPRVVVLGRGGSLISNDGRREIASLGKQALFGWEEISEERADN